MRGQKWTEVMDAELRQFHSDRYSSSQIAAKMARGLTRNAVIGRVHRIGLSGTLYPRQPRIVIKKPARSINTPVIRIVRANGNSNHFRAHQSVETEGPELRCVEIEPRNISLIDLGADECRYPYGDGPFVFCGHPIASRSYCAAHAELSRKKDHGLRGRINDRFSSVLRGNNRPAVMVLAEESF